MAVSPKSLKNLKSRKKGDPALPGAGAPKKIPGLRVLLAEVLGEDSKGHCGMRDILLAMKHKASRGDVKAAELLISRQFGAVTSKTEVSGPDGSQLPSWLTMNVGNINLLNQSNDSNQIEP